MMSDPVESLIQTGALILSNKAAFCDRLCIRVESGMAHQKKF